MKKIIHQLLELNVEELKWLLKMRMELNLSPKVFSPDHILIDFIERKSFRKGYLDSVFLLESTEFRRIFFTK